ncbi:hypothetical protein J1N35_045426 [Gossypium stocksii]|uniref:S-locus receptor kinase C-terminal domain-containing protein n=1 Tax=Gossypium stocksii TaxID=47602 RepID=A0A9D3UB41_9ROSI|nr:hypothetical protein J1N35_045426 [Gossypium stocksii]
MYRCPAACGIGTSQPKKHRLLVIVSVTVAAMVFLMIAIICYLQKKIFKSQGLWCALKMLVSWIRTKISAEKRPENDDPNLQVFSFFSVKAATNNFSNHNKLGEGGYGPVYKRNKEPKPSTPSPNHTVSKKEGMNPIPTGSDVGISTELIG